ncbi:hypothetical protein CH63R_06474 [Colletotrichum higginsianum IMI 349063]|uniref:Uncharacterized protein n=1 Tax=Colletotrichum higginsianum (strain IMI 349063) TaxID=759273 RepID=A0A1B7YFM0_COLHI|nr:hypothetical protein CH63R_06474 [Colletotrichum higginsianum IMI 349063]OBR10782.1 hypothetical protein CH63R_06474 [Colletotrichum higginsianum IMI 349063]
MVSIKCLLPLAGLIVAALSAEIARFDPGLATMTALPRDVMVNPFEAEPTPPPHGRFAVMALKRQISPTCGYFETDGSPWVCETTQTCATNGRYFGCRRGSIPATACREYTDPVCSQSSQGIALGYARLTRVPTSNFDIAYPFCMTGLKLLGRDTVSTLTGFLCANNRFRGSRYILVDPPITTTTSATPLITSTTTVSPSPNSTPPTGPSATPTETTSPVPSGPPVGAIVGGVVGGVALLGAIITAVIWMLARKRQKGRNNNSNGNPDGMAPGVSQHFPHNGMGYSGAPMEAQLSRQTTGFDASKGNYQSTVTPAGVGQSIQHHHGYSHPMPAPSIMSTSTAGPYQPPVSAIPQSPEAAPMYNAVHNGHAMQYTSEVPAINKAGTGNNASELPSPNYR